MTTPILEPRPVPDPAPEPSAMDAFVVDWEELLTWPTVARNPQPVPGSPRDPRPSAPDPGPIPKPNPYPDPRPR